MTIGRQNALLMTAQITGTGLWLLLLRYLTSSGPLTGLAGLTLIACFWFTPSAVHVAGETIWPVARGRSLRVFTGLIGSVAIAVGYFLSLAELGRWQQLAMDNYFERCRRSGADACPAGFIADPPSPPPHAGWVTAGSLVALFALFALLHLWKARAARTVG